MKKVLKRKQKISLKELRKKLKKSEWEELGWRFANCIVFEKADNQILFDPDTEEIYNIIVDEGTIKEIEI